MLVALLSTTLWVVLQQTGTPAQSRAVPVVIVLETEAGAITVEIDTVHAPITAANFLKYVDGGFYDGGEFHRTVRPDTEVRKDVPIQVVQARINQARVSESYPPIPIERTSVTGLKHLNGSLTMARDVTPTSPGPDTATSGFAICMGDQPIMDFPSKRSPDGQGYAVFGRVIAGMEVVKKIHAAHAPKDTPATNLAGAGQTLVPTIKIIRAYRK